MSLFDNIPIKTDENITLFDDKNDSKIETEEELFHDNDNGTTESHDNGNGFAGAERESEFGRIGDTGNGSTGESRISDGNEGGNNGGTDGGNEVGWVQLSFGDSELDGESRTDGNDNATDGGNDSHEQSQNRQNTAKSNAQKDVPTRPSFLNNLLGGKNEVSEEDKPKDFKIKKSGSGRKKKGGMEEEQVEILLESLFDGFALFRGKHWKLKEEEKHIVPALTRILNRMLEALPKGVSENAFNIMDYVIVIGAVGAMIMSRLKDDKQGVQNGGQAVTGNQEKSIGISTGSEAVTREHVSRDIQPSSPNKGNENGISSIAPIKDLANAITRIS